MLIDDALPHAKVRRLGQASVAMMAVLLTALALIQLKRETMYLRDGAGVFLWLWYVACCATIADRVSWTRRVAAVLLMAVWGVYLYAVPSASAAPIMWPPVNILQNTFSDRARCVAQLRPGSLFLLSALRFLDRTYYGSRDGKMNQTGRREAVAGLAVVAVLAIYKFGEALCAALRQQHGSVRRAELDELSATLAMKAAMIGPVVMFTAAVLVSSQNAVNDSLIDFCARQKGAQFVGPFPWSWLHCNQEAIIEPVKILQNTVAA